MIPARAIFDSFNALPAGVLPDDPIDRAQVLLARWEVAQPFHVAVDLPVTLGIGEECGELADAETDDAITDAVGDVAIYVCQVATRNRLAMRSIFASSIDQWRAGDSWRWLLSAVGHVNHLVLKRSQKIREGTLPVEEYRAHLAHALADLIAAVTRAAWCDPVEAFRATADRILARDWRADPARGGEVATATADPRRSCTVCGLPVCVDREACTVRYLRVVARDAHVPSVWGGHTPECLGCAAEKRLAAMAHGGEVAP